MDQRAVDVVVVGAGPVGLMLASELALGGVRAVVLERLREPDPTLKAGGMQALAGEALERRGLGPAVDAEEAATVEVMKAMRASLGAPQGPRTSVIRRGGGGHFAGLALIDQTLQREPDRGARVINQQALERVLTAHAHALGVEVLREHTLESFDDDGERVRVEARGPGGPRAFTAAFLVGCDGGRSTVRKRAGIDFPGTEPTLTGHQAIADLDHPERLLPIGWRRTATGMMAYGPMPGRVAIVQFAGPPADRAAPVTADEIEQSLRHVSGADVRVTALHAATRWTDHTRHAATYRKGRVLLAGDAAHVHPPFGGQGLNLGLLDAVNLGWKLAATVLGRAPDGLLDTYTTERHPVVARALDATRAQIAIMRPDPQSGAMRQIVAELMATSPEVNRYFGELNTGVSVRHDLGDDDPLVGRLVGNLALTVDGVPTHLYALMHDGRAVLVDGDGEASGQAASWSSRVRIVKAPGARSMLVRPDGCIAWAGRAGGLRPALERWFGEP